MSILIKHMEMPTDCILCPLCHGEWQMCSLSESSIKLKGRPSDCPLVPVQPHGRTIDADEFLQRALGTRCFRGDYARMLEELVGESMTIIPAEKEAP